MVELLPRAKIFARAFIAGLLAMVLALQGHALSAGAPYTDSSEGLGLSTSLELCAERGEGEKRLPDHAHAPCSFCILCQSCYLGGIAWAPDTSPNAVDFPRRRETAIILGQNITIEAASRLGWTSSWSQRAPPRISLKLPPPRARNA
jgi:hypothetical protein